MMVNERNCDSYDSEMKDISLDKCVSDRSETELQTKVFM
jgi:hypothetical protein